jgi:dTDP-4-dehydrorhamnose reductase
VRRVRPQIIVNAAGYTAVDRAESEPALADAINARAPAVLAEEAKGLDALLIHYSTDYVFDGNSREPYREEDQAKPLNVYGSSKLAGERAITAAGAAHLILRTSWIYGLRGQNFLLTMRRLAATRDELRVVADQFGVPNWSRVLAEATASLVSPGDTGEKDRHLSPERARTRELVRFCARDFRRRRSSPGRADHDSGISDARPPTGIGSARHG